jgi:hypothetical protein
MICCNTKAISNFYGSKKLKTVFHGTDFFFFGSESEESMLAYLLE